MNPRCSMPQVVAVVVVSYAAFFLAGAKVALHLYDKLRRPT